MQGKVEYIKFEDFVRNSGVKAETVKKNYKKYRESKKRTGNILSLAALDIRTICEEQR